MQGVDEQSNIDSEIQSLQQLHAAVQMHEDQVIEKNEEEVQFLNSQEEHKYTDLEQIDSSSESD